MFNPPKIFFLNWPGEGSSAGDQNLVHILDGQEWRTWSLET